MVLGWPRSQGRQRCGAGEILRGPADEVWHFGANRGILLEVFNEPPGTCATRTAATPARRPGLRPDPGRRPRRGQMIHEYFPRQLMAAASAGGAAGLGGHPGLERRGDARATTVASVRAQSLARLGAAPRRRRLDRRLARRSPGRSPPPIRGSG